MAIFKMFKVPQHKKFEYRPRYFDPDKEALEKRLGKAEPLDPNDKDAVKARISGAFRRGGYYGTEAYRELKSKQNKSSTKRVWMTLAILILLLFVVLNVYLPALLKMLESF